VIPEESSELTSCYLTNSTLLFACNSADSGIVSLLICTTRVLRVLAAHGPWAFGEAKALALDGIELFVICPDVNRAIRSDGGGGVHTISRFKFP